MKRLILTLLAHHELFMLGLLADHSKKSLCTTLTIVILSAIFSNIYTYSPYTILWKLPFWISPCSETPLAKCDLIMLLYFKSRKKCHKNFENRLTNKDFIPKNDLHVQGR